ncbi:MAG TPA: polymorphic toxin type 33 domain-containing protein [Terriglobia bacterium]|nr:polymorphic toxin type 33 domain-containing protein [Terriglobia bacterium]
MRSRAGQDQFDLYKTRDGNIAVKPKGGSGTGEPTGYTPEFVKRLPNEEK